MIGIRDTEKASSLILTPQLHCILHTTDPDDGVAAAARAVLPFCQLLDLHLREEPGSVPSVVILFLGRFDKRPLHIFLFLSVSSQLDGQWGQCKCNLPSKENYPC